MEESPDLSEILIEWRIEIVLIVRRCFDSAALHST
jgi:hypothetical protein